MMRRRGISLLEVVFSLFLVALVILVLTNLFPTSALAVRRAENRVQADLLAEAITAEQASRPFEELVVSPERDLGPAQREGVRLLPSLEVFQPPESQPEHLRGLRVTVRWTERGAVRSVVHELWVTRVRP